MTPTAGVTRVLLVGFMGSGKSTVGAILAKSLGWSFVDFDSHIEATSGRSIPEIFRHDGEAAFRDMEDLAARELLQRDHVVLASGGGWAAQPGRLAGLTPGTVSVWLRVSLSEALRRTEEQAGQRPLLDGSEGPARAGALLAKRTAAYAEADVEVDTDGRTPEDVSARIRSALGSQPLNDVAKAR